MLSTTVQLLGSVEPVFFHEEEHRLHSLILNDYDHSSVGRIVDGIRRGEMNGDEFILCRIEPPA